MQSTLIILGATLIASIVQGMTGVGFSMIVMSLFPFVVSYTQSAQLALMLTFFFSLYTVLKYKKYIDYKAISIPIIFTFIGGAIGFNILKFFSEHYLIIILGSMFVSFSIFVLFTNNRINIEKNIRNSMISGTISGVFTGIASTGGPPLVVYLLSVF